MTESLSVNTKKGGKEESYYLENVRNDRLWQSTVVLTVVQFTGTPTVIFSTKSRRAWDGVWVSIIWRVRLRHNTFTIMPKKTTHWVSIMSAKRRLPFKPKFVYEIARDPKTERNSANRNNSWWSAIVECCWENDRLRRNVDTSVTHHSKICILGNADVGKTSIIGSYFRETK